MKNMKSNVLRLRSILVIALVAAIGFSCKSDVDEPAVDKPGKPDDRKVYVMDISETSEEWDLLVVGMDGSSMLLDLDEANGMLPIRAYIKPYKDSDAGSAWFFNDNGLPDMSVYNDHIVYYNFRGYKLDIAVKKPNGEIVCYYDNETDVNWDTFSIGSVPVQTSGNTRSVFEMFNGGKDINGKEIPFTLGNLLEAIGTGVGLATCITAPLVPGAAIGCGIFLLSQVTGEVVKVATKDDDLASDVSGILLNALGCASIISGDLTALVDCASMAISAGTLAYEQASQMVFPKFHVKGVTLDKTTLSMPLRNPDYGYNAYLQSTVTPDYATNWLVRWTTSDENIVRIDGNDRSCSLYSVNSGTATVTATTWDGDYTAECVVTVLPPVSVTGVTLDKTEITLTRRQDDYITATVLPADATYRGVSWTSSNPEIVAIVEDQSRGMYGRISAMSAGTAVITVTTTDGNKTAICTVTVLANSGTDVTLNKTTLSLGIGASEQLSAAVTPSGAAQSETWSTSNPAAATVSPNGTVTAVAVGTAVITVTVSTTLDGNITATCTVTVTEESTSIMQMVQIPAGTFTMGSPFSEQEMYTDPYYILTHEGPQHQVTLSAFQMGKYEVTQGQWYEVMGTTVDGQHAKHWVNYNYFAGIGDNLPMYYVNWYEALVFCNRLSMREGLSPAYRIFGSDDPSDWGDVPGVQDWIDETSLMSNWDAAVVEVVSGSTGYRLPTEAQWEYACRAGTTTPWNTGSDITAAQARFGSYSTTETVGSYPPNTWGLYDMHGNVLEWCWDWYGAYTGTAQTNPTGPGSPDKYYARVVRGGNFENEKKYARSAHREDHVPCEAYYSLGFRVVRP